MSKQLPPESASSWETYLIEGKHRLQPAWLWIQGLLDTGAGTFVSCIWAVVLPTLSSCQSSSIWLLWHRLQSFHFTVLHTKVVFPVSVQCLLFPCILRPRRRSAIVVAWNSPLFTYCRYNLKMCVSINDSLRLKPCANFHVPFTTHVLDLSFSVSVPLFVVPDLIVPLVCFPFCSSFCSFVFLLQCCIHFLRFFDLGVIASLIPFCLPC